jgi:general secretion pathway protein D
MNGLEISEEEDYHYIHPSKTPVPRKALGALDIKELEKSGRVVLQILPVKHLNAAEAQKLIASYLSPNAVVHELSGQNTLIIQDYESKILDAVTILNRLDVSPLANLNVRLVRIDNAPLFDLHEDLEEIMKALAINKKDHEGVAVIPLERVNSLLMISKSDTLFASVDRWIKELDVAPTENSDNIYIYTVRNSVASELAQIVNNLIRGETVNTIGVGTSAHPSSRGAVSDNKTSGTTTPKISTPQRPNLKGLAKLNFAGEPLLLPDDNRNIILIRALAPDYTRIVKLIERLDNLPRQVLIEVLVAEVKLTDSWEFGVEWALKNNQLSIDGSHYKQTFSTDFTAVAANAAGGFTYAVFNSANEVVGLINALASETDVSLLSSPQVLVLNNEKATVNVGDQVPIVTTETQQTGESTAVDKTVQYKDTGTILNVTPRINYNGIILLDIDQQVSQATETTSSTINSPTISTRELKTKLAVKDGQSILMGGLISKDVTKNQNKVPLLGDIPILGWFFKYEKEVDTKKELLVMITPYVIESEDVLDQYIRQFQDKMQGLRKEMAAKPE